MRNQQQSNFNEVLKQYAGVQVLILGASGFLGRWVARSLCSAGANVVLPVRDESASMEIFQTLGIDADVRLFDLASLDKIAGFLLDVKPSVIFNLAGYGIDRSEVDEKTAFRINADLIRTVCEAIPEMTDQAWKGQRIIHSGTAMEYGSIGGNLSESSIPKPTTLYGRSKLAGTQAFIKSCRRRGISGKVARLFAVYGPGESATRLLPTLIKARDNNEPIEFTAGLHKRDFVYVFDTVEGLIRLGAAASAKPEIVNVASGKLTSIRDFIMTSARVLKISDSRLLFGAIATRTEEMDHDPITNQRLRGLVNWSPKTEIPQGVAQTVAFFDAS